ncbi:MAG: porin [Gammaproteobacteria bacterium]
MKLCSTKITALALAAALPVSVQAADNVTVYGKARMSVDMTDNGTDNLTNVSSNSSRLGFKGSEDFGNRLKAIFQIETLVNLDDGAGSTGTLFGTFRNSYVGLVSGFGTLALGGTDNPYKLATGKLDNYNDSMGDFNAIIGNVSGAGTPFDEREPNSINYWSPKMNGLQFMAGYRPDETSGVHRDRYSMNVNYESGPYYASVAYETHKKDNVSGAGGNDTDGLKFGLSYLFNEDKTKLGLVYESLSEENIASALDRDAWYLALSHKMDSNTVKIAYARADDNDKASDTGANWFVVGLDHALSKRTTVYALYARTNNDSGAQYGLGTGGSSGAVKPHAGTDPSTYSLGINHDF